MKYYNSFVTCSSSDAYIMHEDKILRMSMQHNPIPTTQTKNGITIYRNRVKRMDKTYFS